MFTVNLKGKDYEIGFKAGQKVRLKDGHSHKLPKTADKDDVYEIIGYKDLSNSGKSKYVLESYRNGFQLDAKESDMVLHRA